MTPSRRPVKAPKKRSRWRMIPTHSSSLTFRDYVPYLGSVPLRRRHERKSMQEVWSPLFPDRRVFGTPTGRHALWYFLEHAGLEPGAEVLVAAYNYYVVVRVVAQQGLRPVFVDIDPDTLCIDPVDLERKITPRSRLVIATHMFGNPAPLDAIVQTCDRHGLLLFEDCAHAVGTLYQGQQVGRLGDGALFSFGMAKLVNSFGGGMLTLSERWADGFTPPPHRVPRLHSAFDTFTRVVVSALKSPWNYGWTLHPMIGLALHLEERGRPRLRALLEPSKDDSYYRFEPDSRAPFKPYMQRMHAMQLERLESNVARRRAVIGAIKDRLARVPDVRLLDEDRHGRTNASYFGIYVPDKHALARHLEVRGVYANPQEYFDCARLGQFAEFAADCPCSAYASGHLLRLPSYPTLRDEEVAYIADTIASFFDAP